MFWQRGLRCKNSYVFWLLPYLTLKQLLREIWEATSQVWHPQKVCQIKHSSQLLLGASVDTILDLYPASLPAEFSSGLGTGGAASASGFMARTPFVYWNDRRHFLSTVSVSDQSLRHVQLCDPVDCSMPGLPVYHQLSEFTQTHVHWVGDAIQLSHPLSSPSPPAFNLSQHQGLFKWVSSSHQVAKGLELELQQQSFQWIFRTDFL